MNRPVPARTPKRISIDRRAEPFYGTGASLNDGGLVAFDINFNEVQPVDFLLLAKGIKGRRRDGCLKTFLQIDA